MSGPVGIDLDVSSPDFSVVDGSDQVAATRSRAARLERLAAELAAEASELTAQAIALATQPAGPAPALLSVEDAARVLGLSRTTVFTLVRTGELESIKVGSRRLVPRQSIDAFVAVGLAEPSVDRPSRAS